MKKTILIILTILIAFSLLACAKENIDSKTSKVLDISLYVTGLDESHGDFDHILKLFPDTSNQITEEKREGLITRKLSFDILDFDGLVSRPSLVHTIVDASSQTALDATLTFAFYEKDNINSSIEEMQALIQNTLESHFENYEEDIDEEKIKFSCSVSNIEGELETKDNYLLMHLRYRITACSLNLNDLQKIIYPA